AELDTAADAIEQRWRDRRVALGCEAVGNGADVAVDAKDLLQNDDCPARFPGGRCEVGLNLMPVAGHDGGEFAHGIALWKRSAVNHEEYRPGSREGKRGGLGIGTISCRFN